MYSTTKSSKTLMDYYPPRNTKETNSTEVLSPQSNFCKEISIGTSWKVLADKRRMALQDALEENQTLHKLREKLNNENTQYKLLLEEANSFVEVFKELVDDNNDTGIGDIDISQCNGSMD